MKLIVLILGAAGLAFGQTTRYPGAIDSDSSLFVVSDNVQTTLTAAMSTGDTAAVVSSAAGFVPNMVVTICDTSTNTGKCTAWEHMLVTAVSGNILTVTRAFAGTTARSHSSGRLLSALIDSAHQKVLKDSVIAIETALGTNLSNMAPSPVATAATYNFAAYSCNSSFVCAPGGPSGMALIAGNNTLTMTPVPRGVNGTDTRHPLYVSGGTGAAEGCLITGGSGLSGQPSGQIIINCGNTHSGAWTISSASGGIQEAIVSVGSGGSVAVQPGTYTTAGISISAPVQIVCQPGAKLTLFNNTNLPVVAFNPGSDGSTIQGCEINGNKLQNPSPPPQGNDGVFIATARITVTENYIHDALNAGVLMSGNATQAKVLANRFTGNGRPVWISGVSAKDNLVANNISIGDVDGIHITATGLNTIRGNEISATTGPWESPENVACIYFDSPTVVEANVLTNCGNKGILNFFAPDSIVSNNLISAPGRLATSVYHGTCIELNDADRNVVIGNRCSAPSGAGILLLDMQNTTVVGNVITAAGTWCTANPGELSLQVCSGIAMLWESGGNGTLTGNNTITANTIFGSSQYGIREDDFGAPVNPAHFPSNVYANNIINGSGVSNLSLAPNSTGIISCNSISSLYGDSGCQLNNAVLNGTTLARGTMYIQALPTTNLKIGTGPNGGNNNGWTTTYSDTASKATTDISGTFAGPLPWSITDQYTIFNSPLSATAGTLKTMNYIAPETGANNAIAGTLLDAAGANITASAGLCVSVLLAHTLQAGANTFALSGGTAKNIKSHNNVANNIAAAYAAGGLLTACYDGAQWQDMSQ